MKINFIYIFILILFTTETSTAQFYFFGRNKVQYKNFNWEIIRTKHFNIYYYGQFKELAEIGADYAEKSYSDLKIKFDHIIITKIPLIFYNTHIQFEQTNTTPNFIPEGVGGFFEFMKGRVVIPYMGSLEQFKHVIRHELVHVFMTSKLINELKDHRRSLDRFPPLWFTEGLAEFWSYHWDTQAEMVMRDAVLNKKFVPISNIESINGTFFMYKEGQNFLQFVSDTYGKDKILMLLENFWRFPSFIKDLEFTLGDKLKTIDNKWTYSLEHKYYPLYKNKFPHFIEGKKITNSGFNFSPRFFKKDSIDYIYFIGNYTGYSSIYKIRFIPDSKKIIKPKVVIIGEKQKAFESFHLLQPSLSISKSGIMAFVNKSGGSDVLHLFSIDKNKMIKTYRFKNLISLKSPEFSPNSEQVVFSAIDNKGFSDLFILNLKNGKLLRLTNDYYNDKDPIFSENGKKVIFSSDRTGGKFKRKYNLFEINIDNFKINYLTYTNSNISTPHFSPDYKELYFTSDFDGNYNIWRMNYDNNHNSIGMVRITNFATSVFDFTFVTNNEIVTSAFENFSFQFYAVNLKKRLNSTKKFVRFNFNSFKSKWLAKKIVLTSKSEPIKYKKKYSLDYAFSQFVVDPVYGSRGGAVLGLSDLLGDDKYFFVLYNTAEVQSDLLKDFNVSITKINTKHRTNYGFGIFNFSGPRYDIRQSNEFFYEWIYGGVFSLMYPFSVFNRLEASISIANSNKRLSDQIIGRKALLLTNTISFVHDNSLWGPTGPIDGSRYRILLGYTTDVEFSNVNYYSVILDYRKYFRLGLRSCLATRASIFYNDGKEARRYIAGGSWDLRGWRRWSIRGEKLWLSSVELRFPLIDELYIKFPLFGIGFTSIRGALYFDAGGAWDKKYRETLGSIGTGIRINLFNVITFRYDIGKKIEDNFSRLQPKLFYQFFFGWDF